MTTTDTSLEAFDAIKPRLNQLHETVLATIQTGGVDGATPCEIAERTGILIGTVRNRITELLDMELVADRGVRRVNARGRRETAYLAS